MDQKEIKKLFNHFNINIKFIELQLNKRRDSVCFETYNIFSIY